MSSVNPFIERLPNKQQQTQYMKDYIQTVIDMDLSERSPDDPQDLWYTTPYKLIIIYASKKGHMNNNF